MITDSDRDSQGYVLPCLLKNTSRHTTNPCSICLETQGSVGVCRIYPKHLHPLRCQTCDIFRRCKRGKSFCGENALGKHELHHSMKYGCASHTRSMEWFVGKGV